MSIVFQIGNLVFTLAGNAGSVIARIWNIVRNIFFLGKAMA